ncbi:MAG TPA: PAS and ANTAR domain-containing protein [Microlunatus sp.]
MISPNPSGLSETVRGSDRQSVGRDHLPREPEPILVGNFSWDIRTERWSWSDEMYRIHGYRPGEITPSLELILSHKMPQDRVRAASVIRQARSEAGSFSLHHHLLTADDRQRAVLSVGSFHRVGDGLVCTGFMADLTASERAAGTEAVLAAGRHREAINQAQGALIAVYGLDPTASLALLMRFSQNHNVKLAALAARIVRTLVAHRDGPPSRAAMDQLLLDQSRLRLASDVSRPGA